MLGPGTGEETLRIGEILRKETVGGGLLLLGAVIALAWANSPWSGAYTALSGLVVGPHALHLDLSLSAWAADGLLAIFFFVAGLELKREFVAGDLRSPARAALPVAAAVGGVIVPAVLFLLVTTGAGGNASEGWAIPTATDIAFALAVLAIIGTHLPSGLRTFLLTLAVVDDLIAITIIAVFYTRSLSALPLLLAVVPLGLFTFLVQRRVRSWWLLLPLAAATWVLVHASGVHATVAGVLLAFAVPVVRRSAGPGPGLAEHFEHRFRPLSSGFAVPVFAAALTRLSGRWVSGPFSLGSWGAPVTYAAAVWLAFEVLNVLWPRTQPGQPWFVNWSMVISLVGLGIVGALVFAKCRDRITGPVGERVSSEVVVSGTDPLTP